MKLTEQELAKLFQDSTKNNQAETTVADTMAQTPAAANRIQQTEQLMIDHISAQSARMAMGLQGWSQQLATAIEQAQRPWFNFFTAHNPLKATLATGALAVTMIYSWHNFQATEPQHVPPVMATAEVRPDVIMSTQFGGQPADVMFQGGMDGATDADNLFGASFG